MSDTTKKIYYDGYVGIGTTSPDQPLTIAGKEGTHIVIKAYDGQRVLLLGADGTGGIVSSMSNQDLQLRAGNNETKVIIKNNGNIGMGTDNPQGKLHVVGGAVFQGGRNYFSDEESKGRIRAGAAWGIPGFFSEDGQDIILGVGTGRKVFLGCDPQFVVVQANGHLGVGTQEPGEKIQVDNGFIKVRSYPGDDHVQALIGYVLEARSKGGNVHTWKLYTAPVGGGSGVMPNAFSIWDYPDANGGQGCFERFVIAPAGDTKPSPVFISSVGSVGIGKSNPSYKLDVDGDIRGNIVAPSDARLKTSVEPLHDALDKINALQGVTYQWKNKDEQGRQIGLIAQDVEKVIPEIVSTDRDGYKSLAYDRLTALLIESVKALKAENEALRQRLGKLEGRLTGQL